MQLHALATALGATADEATGRLPGDDLVADPAVQTTRAITVAAPTEDVWPWVVQLGADRGACTSAVRSGADGTTRLLVRERVGSGNPLAKIVMAPGAVVSFVTTRKMLSGIRSRAEAGSVARRRVSGGGGGVPTASGRSR